MLFSNVYTFSNWVSFDLENNFGCSFPLLQLFIVSVAKSSKAMHTKDI